MPNNIETTEAILLRLRAITADARKHYEQLQALETRLAMVETTAEFFKVVDDINKQGYALYTFMGNDLMGLDEQAKKALDMQVKADRQLSFFSHLLHFDERFSQYIKNTKERISAQEMEQSLPKASWELAKRFIDRVKELQVISDLIYSQAENFKGHLQQTGSLDEVDSIEAAIAKMNQQLQVFLENTLDYPKDEKAASALIKYLEKNPHIRSIIQRFDFHELLVDDIFTARANLIGPTHSNRA